MAPRLPLSKLEMIQHMILSKALTASQMARAAECSKRSIINISNNLRRFGNVRAPSTRVGRRRSITPPMIEALCLLEKPGLYVDETVIFLWDEFHIQVTDSSLKRAHASVGWSKKVARQRCRPTLPLLYWGSFLLILFLQLTLQGHRPVSTRSQGYVLICVS